MESTLHLSGLILEIILLGYLGLTGLYLFFFALASLFPLKAEAASEKSFAHFAVIIPGYSEDEVILDVASAALTQPYPVDKYDVVISADHFQEHTLMKLRQMPVKVFDVKFDISTKTRAINHALRNLPDDHYDAVCILDADNVMESDFLFKLNHSLAAGYIAVQGHRIAKNINTNFALLDAISEEINNQIFRKGQRVLGLSSALIGSAMAFEYRFFKSMMQEVEVVGGFDKELEIRLLRDNNSIDYLPDAFVYDEKVQNVKVFSQQRRRWLSAQLHYFGMSFFPATKALFKNGNVEYFNKAVQYLQLPRILLLGLTAIFALSSGLLGFPILTIWWLIAFALVVTALILAVPLKFYRIETLIAILYLPIGFFYMFLSLLKIRGANKKFIHTKHTYNAFQIKRK